VETDHSLAGAVLGLFFGGGHFGQGISELRLLAQLTREPVSSDLRAAIGRSHALGENINTRFGQARSLANAVLLEFGPSRKRDAAMRHHLRRWQPQLRSLFMMRIESFKYRLRVSGYELPEAGRTAQHAYDDRFAVVLGALPHTRSAAFRLGGAQSLHTNSQH